MPASVSPGKIIVAPPRSRFSQLPVCRKLPANVESEGLAARLCKAVFFFSFETDFAGGLRPGHQIGTLAGNGQRRAFTPAVILFIALPETKDNIDAGVIPLDLMPRRCPVCQEYTIIGHGRRLRQAHDGRHESISVRRGICHPCSKTFTILPDWLAPWSPFTLRCRQQACEYIAAGVSVEQAAPHCKDPSRQPEPSALRRWVQRRLLSVCCWVKTGVIGQHFLSAPTILAWDLWAVCRILPFEARSP